jgi:PAS domain S-box-containing protein
MATELVKTGIPVIGEVPWGSHFSFFCETQQDMLDALVPYFKAGLENKELCLWLFSSLAPEQDTVGALRQTIPDLEGHLAKHNIVISPIDEWYVQRGVFDRDKAIEKWKEKVDDALARGYAGLRAIGNADWLMAEYRQSLAEFEKMFEMWIAGQRMVVICTYPLAAMSAIQVFDVAAAHRFVAARRQGVWQVLETPELVQAKAEIKRLNEELEQRVVERTRELEVTNLELRREIAERKQAQEAFRESQQLVHLVLATLPVGVSVIDRAGNIVLANDASKRIWGGTIFSGAERWAQTKAFWHDSGKRIALTDWASVRALSEGQTSLNELIDVETYDGQQKTIHNSVAPIRNAEGLIVGAVMVNEDITERKRAEEEVKRQAARAVTLVRIAARLNKQLDLYAVIQAVCQEAVDTFKVSQATMSLYDKKRELLVYVGGVNIPPEYAATIEPIARSRFDDFLRTLGPIMVVPDIQSMADVPNAEFSSHLDVRTVVTAAMLRDQELIGVLVIGVNGHVREFAKDELTLLKAISDQAAQAIANAKLFKAANEQSQQLRALSTKLVEAQETERRTIARELHDEIGQVLTAVSANLQAIQLSPDASTLAARLDDSLALVDDALSRVRDLSLDLRPSLLDDFGLVSALDWYLERQAERSEFKAEFVAEPPELRLPPSLETTVFRVAQIALVNVVRHAQAKHVWVALRQHEEEIELVIRDDGVGFDVPSALERAAHGATLGLLSMQERARLESGELEIQSRPGQGTEIRARFPIS